MRPTTLVIFPGALGDFMCFLPTLSMIRRRQAARRLAIVVQETLLPLAVRPGLGDVGMAIERAAISGLFVEQDRPTLAISPAGFEDVYSFFGSGERTLRDNLRRLANGEVVCSPFQLPQDWTRHAAFHFLESAGLPLDGVRRWTRLPLSDAERRRASDFWRRNGLDGLPVLGMHAGAGSVRKRWTCEGYATVASWWRQRGGRVLEIVGPDAPERPKLDRDAIVRGFPLNEVAAILERVDLYLGGDTGVSHLAGSVGARGAVLFGSTSARRWRPLGGRMVCLRSLAPNDDGQPISLHGVSTERVVRALRCLLAASLTLTTNGTEPI